MERNPDYGELWLAGAGFGWSLEIELLITTYDFISHTIQIIVVTLYKTIKVVHGYASPQKDIEGRTNIGGQDLWSNLLCGTF